MRTVFVFVIFLFSSVLQADNFIEKLPFDSDDIKEIAKHKKKQTADYLSELYFPKNPEVLLSLLGHEKFKVRKTAKQLLVLNVEFKKDIEALAKSSDDPEITQNCKELLKQFDGFHKFIPKSASPVVKYLVNVDYKFENFNRFKTFYIESTNLDIDLEKFFAVYKPDFGELIETALWHKDPFAEDPNKLNQLEVYLKRNFPEQFAIHQAKSEVEVSDLGLKDVIKEISSLRSWSPQKLQRYAYDISERKDFEKKEYLYCWKLLMSKNEKVFATGVYLIKDKPQPFFPYIFSRMKEAKDKGYSSVVGALQLCKGFKEYFSEKIDVLLTLKSLDFASMAVELIEGDPEAYLNKLIALSKRGYNSKVEDMLLKLERKKSTEELRNKFLKLDFKETYDNTAMSRIGQILYERNFKAGKAVNDYFRRITFDGDSYKNYILEMMRFLKADPQLAFEIYYSKKDRLYSDQKMMQYIFENNSSDKFKNYLRNEHVLNYSSHLETLQKYPGVLKACAVRFMAKLQTYDPFDISLNDETFKALKILHSQNELIPILKNNLGKRTNLQKMLLYPILFGLGEKVEDEKFFKGLDSVEEMEPYQTLELIVLAKRPVNEFLHFIDLAVKKNPKISYREDSFAALLGEGHKSYLPVLINELKKTESPKKQLLLCSSILMLDRENALVVEVLKEVFKKSMAPYPLSILHFLKKEPKLSSAEVEKFLRNNNYSGSILISSKVNRETAQKMILKDLKKMVSNHSYYISDFVLEEGVLSRKISDKVVSLFLAGTTKEKEKLAGQLTSFAEHVSEESLLAMLDKTESNKAFELLAWVAALMGKKAEKAWPAIQKEFEKNKELRRSYLYFAGAKICPDKEERKSYLHKLIAHVKEKKNLAEDYQFKIRKVKLVTEFEEITIPFFKEVLASDKYTKYEKSEALWGFEWLKNKNELLKFFSENLDEENADEYLSFLEMYPKALMHLYPRVSKNYFMYHNKLDDILELRFKGVLSHR